ncbi:SRPBCC family protein [Niveibacterium umoris]|uniref:Uncharacterized protein YndB with AHSA1/START domain n=1 Tax=Niveibacterium umoris TaxID=1193620 RepID=A0A840BKM9_9RHOO|nr:SRPBCC domain-containing protein [Niveibacterium umoris]MBB4014121.1 uncharacterized protein YndB with AHSA1/START domain [Niveibacterium umoris]
MIRLLALIGVLLAIPARAEIIDSAERGFTVVQTASVAASPDRAWQALTSEVGRWWHPEHTWFGRADALSINARAGGCFCEISGDAQVEHARVIFVQPGKLLRMSGALGPMQGMGLSGLIDWQFAAKDGETLITLRSRFGGYAPEGLGALAKPVDYVLGLQLKRLAAHIEGRELPR